MFCNCNHPERCRDDEAHEKLDAVIERLGTFYFTGLGRLYHSGVSVERLKRVEDRLNLLADYFGITFVDEPPRTVIHKKVT